MHINNPCASGGIEISLAKTTSSVKTFVLDAKEDITTKTCIRFHLRHTGEKDEEDTLVTQDC